MKILVTGATGFLGWRTVETLANHGAVESIIATGRTLKPTHTVTHPKVNYLLGDLADRTFVEHLFTDVDYVVNAAALSSPWGKKEDFETANVVTQKHLLSLAKQHQVKRFVFISTPSLYFNYKDRLNVKEEDALPAKFVNHYAATKRKAELMLIASGLPYIILRPRAIIGRGDTVIMPRLIRAIDEGKLKIIGDGKNIGDLTSVGNVANAIWLSLTAEQQAVNQIYNITNGEPIKLWDAISDVLGRLNRTAPTKKVPFAVVRTVARFLEWAAAINKKEPTLTQYGAGTLAVSLTMDISKAKQLLQYEPSITTEQSLTEFINWYKANEEN